MSPYSGGDEGNRTPDLLLARQALSHLSYTPELLLLWVFAHKLDYSVQVSVPEN